MRCSFGILDEFKGEFDNIHLKFISASHYYHLMLHDMGTKWNYNYIYLDR